MYLRPGNLYKEFSVEESIATVNESGRPVMTYNVRKDVVLKGCLSIANTEEKNRFSQVGHPITHTIVQDGRKMAKEDDRLHLGDRTFLIKGIDEVGDLGICTIYYAEERKDVS